MPVAFAALGVAQVRLGQLDRAVETMERAHYLSPADPLILYQYGLALKAAGKAAAAQQRFSAADYFRSRGETGSQELVTISAWMPSTASSPPTPSIPSSPPGRPAVPPRSADPPARVADASPRIEEGGRGPSPRTERLRPRQPQIGQPPPPPPPPPPTAFAPSTPAPPSGAEPTPTAAMSEGPLASLHRTSETLRPPGQEVSGWASSPPAGNMLPEQYRPRVPERAGQDRRVIVGYRSGQAPEPYDSEMEHEPPPGFLGILAATLQLWLNQPLPWLVVLALSNAVAVLLEPTLIGARWVTSLVWSLALALGAAPAFLILTDQWVFGRALPRLGPTTFLRLTRSLLLTGGYLLVALAPLLILLGLRSTVPIYFLLPAALILTMPIHALFAPALVLAATDGPGGIAGLRISFLLAGKRTWLHLAVMVLTAIVIGGALGGLVWALTRLLVGVGDAVPRMWQVVGLSLGEGLWCALVTACGTDALATRLEGDEDVDSARSYPDEGGAPGAYPARS